MNVLTVECLGGVEDTPPDLPPCSGDFLGGEESVGVTIPTLFSQDREKKGGATRRPGKIYGVISNTVPKVFVPSPVVVP